MSIKDGCKIKTIIFIGMSRSELVRNAEDLRPNANNFSLHLTSRSWKLEGYLSFNIPEDAIVHGNLPTHFVAEGAFERTMERDGPLTVLNGFVTFQMKEVEEQSFDIQFE
jgi:hypothetical protein